MLGFFLCDIQHSTCGVKEPEQNVKEWMSLTGKLFLSFIQY